MSFFFLSSLLQPEVDAADEALQKQSPWRKLKMDSPLPALLLELLPERGPLAVERDGQTVQKDLGQHGEHGGIAADAEREG